MPFLIWITVLFSACHPAREAAGFRITGSVPDEITGKVYLQEYKNRKYIDVDSVEIVNGEFTFTGSVANEMVYTIAPEQKSKRVQIFLGNSPLKIGLSRHWELVELEGSENAEMFHRVLPESIRGTFRADSFLSTHPASPVAIYFLNRNIYRYDYGRLKSIREQLPSSLSNHPYVEEIDDNLRSLEAIQPGKTAPDFTLSAPDGDTLSLGSLRGKYILIDFWASWCPDCRKASPKLVELYRRYGNKNFTIVGVSLDEDKERWSNAIEKDGLAWHQVIAENGWNSDVAKAYAIRWIPTSFLIDPQGVIVDKNIEVNLLEAKIAELLD